MKPGVQLRFGQQVTMTPQLQQAIHLLQLSNFELQTEIQQALESNIMLEIVEDEDEDEYET
ncbi:MAG: RNA polymerase factor sigma-54, partial [Candidatus Parabeggiatoa sp. nov. 1]